MTHFLYAVVNVFYSFRVIFAEEGSSAAVLVFLLRGGPSFSSLFLFWLSVT